MKELSLHVLDIAPNSICSRCKIHNYRGYTADIKEHTGGLSPGLPVFLQWIKEYIAEKEQELSGGACYEIA